MGKESAAGLRKAEHNHNMDLDGVWGPWPRDFPFSRTRLKNAPRQSIDRALQNHRGRCRIDAHGAFGAAEVLVDQAAFGAGGAPAFVPQQDRQAQRGEVAGVGAAGLAARAFAAVHVDGQADDDALDGTAGDQGGEFGFVGAELAAFHRFAGAGDTPVGVAEGGADGLRAEVEPDQPAAAGQVGAKFAGMDGNGT